MESNRNYSGTIKNALAAGLIGLAAVGCGGASFEPGNGTTEDGGDAAATGGAGGSAGHEGGVDAGGKGGAGHEGGVDANGGKAGSGASDAGGGDTGGAGGQPCKADVQKLNGGGEYVDTCGDDAGKCSDNVKMLCFTIMANCDAVLNEVDAEEQYVTSPTNGILSNGTLWINDQIVKDGVFPVNVSAGTNKLVFANFNGSIQNGALTKVCAGGDIKANSGGSAKLVIDVGGLKMTLPNNAGKMEGYQFTVNPM